MSETKGPPLYELRELRQRIQDLESRLGSQASALVALRESERQYKTVVETTQDFVFKLAPDGRVLFVNQFAAEQFGRSSEEIVGRKIADLFPAKIAAQQMRSLEKALHTKASVTVEGVNIIGGKEYWLHTRLTPILSGGQVVAVVGVSRDITVFRKSVVALRESEERYHKLLDATFDGILVHDKGIIQDANDAAARMFGYEPGKMVGLPLAGLSAPESLAETVRRITSPLGDHWEGIAMRKDGSRFHGEISATEHQRDGRVVRLIAIRDITERKRLQEEILKADKLESVGLLAGGIAHDFNNILTALLGNIVLAQGEKDPKRLQQRLAQAEQAIMRASDLTRQLLVFSRGGAMVKKTASIGELVRESAEFVVHGSQVRCVCNVDDDLKDADVDASQLHQVIHNVVLNALQSMPKGGNVLITCENVVLPPDSPVPLAPGPYIRISIEDSGVGIPTENLPKVFDPYFTTRAEGSGLGLASSYFIIKKHAGHITIDSEVDQGTTVRILLPASTTPKPAALSISDEYLVATGQILVMDDEPTIRDVVELMLEELGLNVVVTADGSEAINAFRTAFQDGNPFKVVILDLTVPGGMGGRETIPHILAIDPAARVIASSGYSNDPTMSEHARYGFMGVLAKPYRLGDLKEVLHKVLR